VIRVSERSIVSEKESKKVQKNLRGKIKAKRKGHDSHVIMLWILVIDGTRDQ
jgi:hypothetical protein